jgi:hypothetical protein
MDYHWSINSSSHYFLDVNVVCPAQIYTFYTMYPLALIPKAMNPVNKDSIYLGKIIMVEIAFNNLQAK